MGTPNNSCQVHFLQDNKEDDNGGMDGWMSKGGREEGWGGEGGHGGLATIVWYGIKKPLSL